MRSEDCISWRKSSYSGAGDENGGSNCLEVLAAWRKSSYSGHGDDQGGSSCLEVNDTSPAHILVRDSKRVHGPVLTLSPSSWSSFVAALR
ncbi:DUF397 domain-containing protein [Streptomyces cinnamoneus]|uniref:DUF397 domain-containing protein n=1 Tax=Streptomyces cinnamoneus TaxID=53446 RepID=UPI0033D20084